MLEAARQCRAEGVDVVIGYVETHKRAETEALVAGLEVIPRKRVEYRDTLLYEMDVDAVLARKPQLALVDEFARTNAPSPRHPKRYQDSECSGTPLLLGALRGAMVPLTPIPPDRERRLLRPHA
jgi:two-component system, OmpR family, sensor histidine kinase KdpD